VRQTLGVSERRTCRTLGQHRSTQRKVPEGRPDEDLLTADIIDLATQYGRYGYLDSFPQMIEDITARGIALVGNGSGCWTSSSDAIEPLILDMIAR
jgi:hypothetical protein